MPDNKFDKQLDRQAVPFDYKIRIIDLMQNHFEAPIVGIYDEPVRYYKMNLEWVKIFAGWLAWMESTAFWKDAEDDSFIGIQEILKFEEGIELPMSIDYEALKAAISDGTYKAWNDLAKQVVSGTTTNINVDANGNVTTGTGTTDPTDAVELPIDDPLTAIDETAAAKQGGMINVRFMMQSILNDMAAWHFGAVPEVQAVSRLSLLYGLEGANVDAFVNYYYTVDASPDTVITLLSILDSYFYCRGLNYNNFSKYILKEHTPTTDRETLLKFAPCLTPELLSQWYESGIDTPSTTYQENSCVPSKPETMPTITSFGTNYQSQTSWKKYHRLRITTNGLLTDNSGHKRDFWYYDGAAANPVFVPASTSIQQGVGITKPTINQVPFSATGTYVFTLDLGSSDGVMIFNLAAGGTFVGGTGGINVTIEDLGEIGV